MSSKLVVEFLDCAAFDAVDQLPQPHRDSAQDLLDHLQTRPPFGKALENHAVLGDLAGSRTLYVIDFGKKRVDWPPPHRIVYRLLPDERAPKQVQVIWAGPRDDGIAYETAARRLGRL